MLLQVRGEGRVRRRMLAPASLPKHEVGEEIGLRARGLFRGKGQPQEGTEAMTMGKEA